MRGDIIEGVQLSRTLIFAEYRLEKIGILLKNEGFSAILLTVCRLMGENIQSADFPTTYCHHLIHGCLRVDENTSTSP